MDIDQLEISMNECIEYLKEELGAIRAGRANPQILNKITVEYYGVVTPLQQVAAISVPEPRQLMIIPWDKSLIGEINKAISKADLGLNPIQDGNGVRLTFPELNEQRRKELVKNIKELGENTKVAIRNNRRDAMDTVKKAEKESTISEDERHTFEEKIQKITDKWIEKVDETIDLKEKEIMEI